MISGTGSVSLHGSIQLFQSSAMPAGEKIAPKKLKIKLSKLSSESDIVSAEVNLKTMGSSCSDDVTGLPELARFSLNSRSALTTTSGKEKRIVIKNNLQKNNGDHHVDEEMVVSERYNVGVSMTYASKRGHVLSLDNQKAKKQKIDSRVMQQCSMLLKKLMAEPFGWVFNQPVDPVALKIPDYFSVISEPMDLGTIKSKVEKKLYTNTEEFATDVRLTFSNAMRYNPPINDVHILAKRLLGIFESKWKMLVAKWSAACLNVGQQSNSNEKPNKTLDLRRDVPRAQASRPKESHKVLLSSVQRQKLRKDLVELSNRKIPPSLLEQFRKMGLMGQHDDRIEVDIDAIDEITECELEKVLRSYHHLRSTEPAHSQYSCGPDSLQKDLHKGNDNSSNNVFGSASEKSRQSSICISASCESTNSRRNHHTDLPSGKGNSSGTALVSASGKQTSSVHINGSSESMNRQDSHNNFTIDADSDRYSGRDDNNTFLRNLDLPVNDATCRTKIKSDPDSNRGVSVVVEQNVDHSSHPPTPGTAAVSEEGWENNTYDSQLSPSKALRAAMLRSRFADTIVKAQQKTLLDNGEKIDPVKLKQEKERLEKRQREEKARIEAQIRAAESAARNREQMELKKQREREREAARIALQKMERTVEIYENLDILKELEELEILAGSPQSDDFTVQNDNPLQRLGLFIKNEYLEDKEGLDIEESANFNWDIDEGENCKSTGKDDKSCNMDLEEGVKCGRDDKICNKDVEEGEIAS